LLVSGTEKIGAKHRLTSDSCTSGKNEKERKSIYIVLFYQASQSACNLHHVCLSFVSVHRMALP